MTELEVDQVYNFWQDETNVRGLWRRATLASYKTENPEWQVLIDIDALASSEDENWVYNLDIFIIDMIRSSPLESHLIRQAVKMWERVLLKTIKEK